MLGIFECVRNSSEPSPNDPAYMGADWSAMHAGASDRSNKLHNSLVH